MTCPRCGEKLKETHVEERILGKIVWRRFKCLRGCNRIFHTHETIVLQMLAPSKRPNESATRSMMAK